MYTIDRNKMQVVMIGQFVDAYRKKYIGCFSTYESARAFLHTLTGYVNKEKEQWSSKYN